MNNRDEAIIDEFKPPQQDIATHIGTMLVPTMPIVRVARSVATADEEIISIGVSTAKYATLI